MSAGIEFNANVLNQLGTPAMNSNLLANRPAAGFTGRIFISTDTREIYRDTGSTWELIGSGAGSVNIYNSDGTLTTNRTVNIGANNLLFQGSGQFRINSTAGDAFKNFSSSAALSRAGVNGVAYAILYTANESGFVGFQQRDGTSSRYGVNGLSEVIAANTSGLAIIYPGNLHIGQAAEYARFTNAGRFLLNTTVDAGFLADINGTSIFRNDMLIQSLSGVRIVPSNGNLNTGGFVYALGSGGGDIGVCANIDGNNAIPNPGARSSRLRIQGGAFSLNTNQVAGSTSLNLGFTYFPASESTGGTINLFNVNNFVGPSSGNAFFSNFRLNPTLNFTGTYNGTFIGLRYDPVTTSMVGVDHIAIQTELGRCNFLETQAAAVSGKANYSTFSRLTQNLAAGGSVGGGAFYVGGSMLNVSNFAGSFTFGSASINGGAYSGSTLNFSAAGTVTMNQAGLRAFSGHQIFNQFGGNASGTITHFAGMQILGLYNQNTGVITPNINNAYGLIINDLNDYSHTFNLINRWGIYQSGSNENNYLAGKLLIGTTTVTARNFHLLGDMEFTTTLSGTSGGTSGQHLVIYVNGNQYKIKLENP